MKESQEDLEERELSAFLETHWCTLGGWIPKVEAQILRGEIAHKKWYWRSDTGEDVEMNGPLTFIVHLSCGHHQYEHINGKSEEELQQEYVGKNVYCLYCRGRD